MQPAKRLHSAIISTLLLSKEYLLELQQNTWKIRRLNLHQQVIKMGFLKQVLLLQMTCYLVMIVTGSSVVDSSPCSNQTGAEASMPVNIQIFTSAPSEPSSNGTRDVLNAIQERGVAMATMQSHQDDLATHFGAQFEEISDALVKLNDTIWPRLDELGVAVATMQSQQDDLVTHFHAQLEEISDVVVKQSVCRTLPRDCDEVLLSGDFESGVYDIQPDGFPGPIQVSCDMETDGGGWTVFQRREDGSVDFQRNWADYKYGFGEAAGEHWLGNNKIHILSNQKTYVLRVDLTAFNGDTAYAEYQNFSINSERDKFRLNIGDYNGTAGDSLSNNRGSFFSTYDADNDASSGNCATIYHNSWWNKNCFYANPNGLYFSDGVCPAWNGIVWTHWKLHTTSMTKLEMKIRPS